METSQRALPRSESPDEAIAQPTATWEADSTDIVREDNDDDDGTVQVKATPRMCIRSDASADASCAEKYESSRNRPESTDEGADNSSSTANISNANASAEDGGDQEDMESILPGAAADMAEALPGPLAACGRHEYLSVYWAGKQKIYVRHMGEFNGWKPQDMVLPMVVDIKPGVPLFALSRPLDYNGVIWAGKGKVHHVYMDSKAWGVWKNTTIPAWGMKNGSHLAAAGQPEYMSIWWAAKGKVVRLHWGSYNNWTARTNYVGLKVPVLPSTKLYAMSMSYYGPHGYAPGYAGVVWAGDGIIHHLHHNAEDWTSFKYDALEQEGMTKSTPLAACGRTGSLNVFWAGESKVHHLRMSAEGGYLPERRVLEPTVPVVPGMPLYAMCRDDGYNGVVWTGFGGTHHLYEDLQAWGVWKYHDLTLWQADHLESLGFDALMDTSVHKELEWSLPTTPAGIVALVVGLRLGLGLLRRVGRVFEGGSEE